MLLVTVKWSGIGLNLNLQGFKFLANLFVCTGFGYSFEKGYPMKNPNAKVVLCLDGVDIFIENAGSGDSTEVAAFISFCLVRGFLLTAWIRVSVLLWRLSDVGIFAPFCA
jgi:hypothetical protein